MRPRILLDECVHAGVRAAFPSHPVKTVTEAGWRSVPDGQLLLLAERQFDVLLTVDRRLEFQNQLSRFRLGFVIVRVPSNKLEQFVPLFPRLLEAALSVKPGHIIHIGP